MAVKRLLKKCINCNVCKDYVTCPVGNVKISIETGKCIGCGACIIACPEEALILEENYKEKKEIFVDNKKTTASGAVKDALKASGHKIK